MDLVQRLHRRLAAAAPASLAHDSSTAELTIADVYQRLIPYRAVRVDLGIGELAEYEHALLRLFSGEGEHLEVVDPQIRDELQRELASVNPILGIYRDYPSAALRLVRPDQPETEKSTAAPTVSVEANALAFGAGAGTAADTESPAAGKAPLGGSASTGDPVVTSHRSARDVAESFAGAGREVAPPAAAVKQPAPSIATPNPQQPLANGPGASNSPRVVAPIASQGPATEPTLPKQCWNCERRLPDIPHLQYCPGCGLAQSPVACPRCDAAIEPDWSFCVRCGASRDAAPTR